MADERHGVVDREVRSWSLKFRCILLVLIVLIAAAGIFGAVTTVMDDSAGFASGLVIALCGIVMPLGVGLLIWFNRIETEVNSNR